MSSLTALSTATPTRKHQRKKSAVMVGVLAYLFLVFMAAVYIVPFLLSAVTAFKSLPDIAANPASPTFDGELGSPTLEGLRFLDRDSVNFPRWTFNSLFVTIVALVGRLFWCSLAGYSLARMRYRGRELVFAALLILMSIPAIVIAIPKFIVLKEIGFINTYQGMIVPLMFDASGVFLMKQFMEQVPLEAEEAAVLDGASRMQAFFKVVLPMAMPGLLTLTILHSIGIWNNFQDVLISTVGAPELRTLPVGLSQLLGDQGQTIQWNAVLLGALITTIPAAIVFFVFQRYFRQGVSTSGLAGQ